MSDGHDRRAASLAARLAVLLLVWTSWCRSHHSVAHGTSEGIRATTAWAGQSARATRHVMLLEELARSDESGGGPRTKSVTSLVASYLVHPWVALGAQVPWLVVAEGDGVEHGLGDIGGELIVTPHGDRLRHRVPSFGVRASFPTRTVTLQSDPGRSYSVSPFAAFTRSYGEWYWQTMLLTSLESRPAGLAWDGSAGAFGGYSREGGFGVSVGAWLDSRLASYCAKVEGGLGFCREGRVTDTDRPQGATRGYGLLQIGYELGGFAVVSGLQLPVTARRDFDVAGFAGVRRSF